MSDVDQAATLAGHRVIHSERRATAIAFRRHIQRLEILSEAEIVTKLLR